MTTSQDGWAVLGSSTGPNDDLVAGTYVRLAPGVRAGDVATVLRYSPPNSTCASKRSASDGFGGYNLRPIRGQTNASLRAVHCARWPANQLVTAAAISGAESAYNPTATHLKSNGTTDYDLWQIKSIHTRASQAASFGAPAPTCWPPDAGAAGRETTTPLPPSDCQVERQLGATEGREIWRRIVRTGRPR